MPSRRTRKTDEVKQRLLARLENGFYQPGDRFLSNRDVAELFSVSYQTAHRLIAELCAEGVLQRRPQSGTYVPGGTRPLVGAQVLFHPRAAMQSSFGSKMLAQLVRRLAADRIDWTLELVEGAPTIALDRVAVIWESPVSLAACARQNVSVVLVNDRPRVGLDALFVDSVSTDDFAGGVCAAQLLQARTGARKGFAVLGGPADDPRSRQRVAGFLSMAAGQVVEAQSWFFEAGYASAALVVPHAAAGLFCANDQLAAAVIRWCRDQGHRQPPIVGFDDAPVAESLNLTTIAIPWDELVEGVVRVLKRRLAGDRSTSSQQIFHPRPVIRGFGLSPAPARRRDRPPELMRGRREIVYHIYTVVVYDLAGRSGGSRNREYNCVQNTTPLLDHFLAPSFTRLYRVRAWARLPTRFNQMRSGKRFQFPEFKTAGLVSCRGNAAARHQINRSARVATVRQSPR